MPTWAKLKKLEKRCYLVKIFRVLNQTHKTKLNAQNLQNKKKLQAH